MQAVAMDQQGYGLVEYTLIDISIQSFNPLMPD